MSKNIFKSLKKKEHRPAIFMLTFGFLGMAYLLTTNAADPSSTVAFQCPTYSFSKKTAAVGTSEASGLIESRKQPGVFWTHNDSGGTTEIFAVSSAGKILSRHTLSGTTNIDWEDISFGPGPDPTKDYIYVGDVGSKGRSNYKIYRVPEPTVSLTSSNLAQTIPSTSVEAFGITYKLKSGAAKSPDVEGFSVDPITKDIYIFDKEINNRTISGINGTSYVFRLNGSALSTSTTNIANEVANVVSNVDSQSDKTYPPGFVGSDISADGKLMIAKNYGEIFIWERGTAANFDTALNARTDKRPTCFYQNSNITGATIPSSEAITFSPNTQNITFLEEGTSAPLITFANTSFNPTNPTPVTGSPFTIVAAGDVGKASDRTRQQRTGDLIRRINPTYLLALGDMAYESGTDAEFAANYAPYWGTADLLAKTKPIPGNHEYYTSGATGYFNYFDPGNTGKFGTRDKGYYAFTKDNWLFLMLNSECSKIGGCRNDSVQSAWVSQQLAANPEKCVVASWHKPRVTSGHHADYAEMNDIWNKIVARKGVVLTSHNHLYTRSVPLGNNALPDPNGILQFVSGAGGATFYTDASNDTRDAKRIESTLGVLKMTMNGNKVQYQFINTNDQVLDEGTQTLGCSAEPANTSDTTAPTVPGGLTATPASSSSINLKWSTSTDNVAVTGYYVYRNNTRVGTTTTNSFTDTGLTASTSYTYTVTAFDATSNESGKSSAVSATTQAVSTTSGAIPAPTGVYVTPGNGLAILSWTPSTDPRVDQYSIRYTPSNSTTKSDGKTWTYPGRTSGWPLYRVLGLTPGVKYDFQITAIDNKGTTTDSSDDLRSAYSTTVTATPTSVTNRQGDLNGDGLVNVTDLNILAAAWDPNGTKPSSTADLNKDGKVDIIDLNILFSGWDG